MSDTGRMHVIAMGSAHPSTKITNQFIEELNVGTNAEWIREKIGIEERLSTLPLEYINATKNLDPREARKVASMTPTELGIAAATQALKRAGIQASQIGLLVVNCCTPEATVPSESIRLARALGVKAECYEVFSACPVFALHLDFLSKFEELPEYVLCISAATLTQNVNYSDRSDGAIWGDGAAAWIVSTKHKGPLKVLDTLFMADPTRCDAVVVDTYGHFHQDGRAVRDFSVRQTVRLIRSIEERFQVDWSRDAFIGHQANSTMLLQITNNRQIPASNHWHNVTFCGNQAGASAPAVLAEHWDKLVPGMKVIIAVVGAGLSWGSIVFEVLDHQITV